MFKRTHSFLFVVSMFVSAPILFGAKGGCGGEVVIGDDECTKDACGGMPEIACADGSSPFTGRCLAKSDGKCMWEPRTCPGDTQKCDSCETPTIACVGGGAPYDGCELKDGKCVARYVGCANQPCQEGACGPALGLPSYTCVDGTTGGSTGRCLRDAAGACSWEVKSCARKCSDEECGPMPPVAPCPDGNGPSISCAARTDGTCGWNVGTCNSAPECPEIASSCATGCTAVTARPYDAARNCLLPARTVGCLPYDLACPPVLLCSVRATDSAEHLFAGGCFSDSASWKRCGDARAEAVFSAPECP